MKSYTKLKTNKEIREEVIVEEKKLIFIKSEFYRRNKANTIHYQGKILSSGRRLIGGFISASDYSSKKRSYPGAKITKYKKNLLNFI